MFLPTRVQLLTIFQKKKKSVTTAQIDFFFFFAYWKQKQFFHYGSRFLSWFFLNYTGSQAWATHFAGIDSVMGEGRKYCSPA